jgi:hypothetical protein
VKHFHEAIFHPDGVLWMNSYCCPSWHPGDEARVKGLIDRKNLENAEQQRELAANDQFSLECSHVTMTFSTIWSLTNRQCLSCAMVMSALIFQQRGM